MQLSTSLHLLEYANYAIRHHLPCKKVPELKDRGSSCMINNSIYQDSIYQDTHDNANIKGVRVRLN
jgi:hypothetical protein